MPRSPLYTAPVQGPHALWEQELLESCEATLEPGETWTQWIHEAGRLLRDVRLGKKEVREKKK